MSSAEDPLDRMAEDERAPLGPRPLPPHRLPGHQLLGRPQAPGGPPPEPGRGGSGAAGDLREAGHPPARAGRPGGGGGGRGVRLRVRGHHLQGQAGRARHHLLPPLRGGARAPGPGAQIPGQGSAAHGQLLRRPQLGGVLRGLFRVHPQGGALPHGTVHLFPHQRRRHRPVRAHPHHRRRGQLRLLPGGLHRPHAGREPVARGGGGLVAERGAHIKYSTVQNWYPGDEEGRGGIYNFVTKRGLCKGDHSKISWTQVSCAATTRWASSTRWPCPTCVSRRTPAPR